MDVPDEDKHLLVQAEGLGQGYDEQEVEVRGNGDAYVVQAYVAAPSHFDDTVKPFSWYLALVLRGAQARGLPRDYVSWIGTFESVDDIDESRAAKADKVCEC